MTINDRDEILFRHTRETDSFEFEEDAGPLNVVDGKLLFHNSLNETLYSFDPTNDRLETVTYREYQTFTDNFSFVGWTDTSFVYIKSQAFSNFDGQTHRNISLNDLQSHEVIVLRFDHFNGSTTYRSFFITELLENLQYNLEIINLEEYRISTRITHELRLGGTTIPIHLVLEFLHEEEYSASIDMSINAIYDLRSGELDSRVDMFYEPYISDNICRPFGFSYFDPSISQSMFQAYSGYCVITWNNQTMSHYSTDLFEEFDNEFYLEEKSTYSDHQFIIKNSSDSIFVFDTLANTQQQLNLPADLIETKDVLGYEDDLYFISFHFVEFVADNFPLPRMPITGMLGLIMMVSLGRSTKKY